MQHGQDLPPLGFISLDIIVHRPPGDPYNTKTWPFPLIHEKAHGTPESAVVSATMYADDLLDRFVEAAQRLADRGAVGVITSCGFLAMVQPELSARSPVPIMTSALLQLPSLLALTSPRRMVGILTFDGARLGDAHLRKLGVDPARCRVRGAPHEGALQRHIRRGDEYVHEDIERELVGAAQDMAADGEVALILLECTNMPPFSEAIRAATGLPVYDVHTAGLWFYSGLVNSRPGRWGAIPRDDTSGRT